MARNIAHGSIRFIHTADWHIGKQFSSLGAPLEKLAYLRQARIESIRRIAQTAKSRNVSAVLVAGDVFDHNYCGDRIVRETIHVLEECDIDWVLLPGNHDPDGPASIWSRFRRIGCPCNVHIASAESAHLLCDDRLAILAAPLNRKRYSTDPTEHLGSLPSPASASVCRSPWR
jgi:3',5'-cyclic AMP phosphodiesterase CpdA